MEKVRPWCGVANTQVEDDYKTEQNMIYTAPAQPLYL